MGEVHNVMFQTMEAEAEGLTDFIQSRLDSGRVSPGDVLVLTNWRKIAYGLRDHLVRNGYDAHSYFTEEAFDTDEAKRAITLLTLLADPDDRMALRAWLALDHSTQRRPTYRRILALARNDGLTVKDVLERLKDGRTPLRQIGDIAAKWDELTEALGEAQAHGEGLEGIIDRVLPADIPALSGLRAAAERVLELESVEISLRDFVASVRKQVAAPEVPLTAPYVRLMSLHKSKGLTVKMVVIAGLVDGLIPVHPRTKLADAAAREHFEEQRRVLYVGLTRATETVVLSKYQTSNVADARVAGIPLGKWVGRGVARTIASPFLAELGAQCPNAEASQDWRY